MTLSVGLPGTRETAVDDVCLEDTHMGTAFGLTPPTLGCSSASVGIFISLRGAVEVSCSLMYYFEHMADVRLTTRSSLMCSLSA